MTSVEAKKSCSLCEKFGIKSVTKQNIYYYYIPLHGLVSYAALSVNVMNPTLATKLMPKKDMTNVLLFGSMVGSAFYLYGRPHLQTVPNSRRGLYAILGGTLFSMGSVLAWAIIRSALPNNAALATIAGAASGVVIVKLSTDYFDECDKILAAKK